MGFLQFIKTTAPILISGLYYIIQLMVFCVVTPCNIVV